MGRPKADSEAGRIAAEKWRETMLKKYGGEEGLHKKMQAIGARGGSAPSSRPKGFASNPEFARVCGYKGGRISRRTNIKNGFGHRHTKDIDDIEKVLESLEESYDGGN